MLIYCCSLIYYDPINIPNLDILSIKHSGSTYYIDKHSFIKLTFIGFIIKIYLFSSRFKHN